MTCFKRCTSLSRTLTRPRRAVVSSICSLSEGGDWARNPPNRRIMSRRQASTDSRVSRNGPPPATTSNVPFFAILRTVDSLRSSALDASRTVTDRVSSMTFHLHLPVFQN